MKKKYFNLFGKIVILVIIASFILTGIFSGVINYGQEQRFLYQIGEHKINENLYQKYKNRAASSLQDLEDFDSKFLDEFTLDLIHQTYAILIESKNLGIEVSEKEVFKEISNNENFQKEGKFSRDLYFEYLKFFGIKAKDLEEEIKINLTIRNFLNYLENMFFDLNKEYDYSFLENLAPLKMIEYEKEDLKETISLQLFKEKFDFEISEEINKEINDEINNIKYKIFEMEQNTEENILRYKLFKKNNFINNKIEEIKEKHPLNTIN